MNTIQIIILLNILYSRLTQASDQQVSMVNSNGSMDQYYIQDTPDESSLPATTVTNATTGVTTQVTKKTNPITVESDNTTTMIPITNRETNPTLTSTYIPTTTTTSTTTPTSASTTSTSTVCGTVWQQCGGTDYEGSSCCQNGLSCAVVNEWWSRCVPISTTLSSSSFSSSSSSTKPSKSVSVARNRGASLPSPVVRPAIQWAAALALLI